MLRHLISVLPTFTLACLILAALPGPATALFIHRTVRDGRRSGLAAVAGNEIGLLLWLLAGGAGLSALLEASRLLFDAMHVVGACVLVVIGIQAWRGADRAADELIVAAGTSPGAPGSAFRASLLSIAANPKAAVFAVSFLPQFLPRHGPVLPTLVVLVALQVSLDSVYCCGIVLAAGRAGGLLRRIHIRRRVERALALILIGLGCELSLELR